jgi:hypothetical protein
MYQRLGKDCPIQESGLFGNYTVLDEIDLNILHYSTQQRSGIHIKRWFIKVAMKFRRYAFILFLVFLILIPIITAEEEQQTTVHPQKNGFNLTGSHAKLECAQCHNAGFKPTLNPQCVSCHQDAHRGGLGSECSGCHTPTLFRNASRAFHKSGTFPLEGRHLALACDACHIKGEVQGTPNRCYDCHWIRRQDDPFRTQLGNECEDCHNPISWSAVRFNHPTASGVALNAGHRSLTCEECHINSDFLGSPVLCYSCHQSDYQSTRDPNHATAGFSTVCEECHRISDPSFAMARFNHNSLYPLLGAHTSLDCSACHGNNIYQGTPQDCYACHQSNYQSTLNPNHATAGFSTDCELCHQASHQSWDQGQFAHPDFPITSGKHANFDCSECHTNPLNYQVFTCTACHSSGDTREHHEDVSGYLYDSQACYSCHPQGRH